MYIFIDCVPVVALKNCEPEVSELLPEFSNMCLRVSCFPDCRKVSSVVPAFKNVGENSTAKTNHPFRLLSTVSKSLFHVWFYIFLINSISSGTFI